jgi:putative hemolysin
MKMVFDNNSAIYLVVNTCNRILLKILQIKPNTDGNVTEEEIKAFIREEQKVDQFRKLNKIL